jgi:hypothetical protein
MTKRAGLIVEEIVDNLRPFKIDEKFAADRTRRCISILEQLSKADGKKLRPSDAKKKRLKYRRDLAALIAASEQLPAGALDMYMFFAQTPERRQRYDADCAVKCAAGRPFTNPLIEAREAGAEVLRQLKGIASVVAKDVEQADGKKLKSQDGILPDLSFKTPVAGYARLLILETSKRAITGTAEGPYRRISSLLYKAIRGDEIDFKRWCDAEIKRQGEHEKIIRSFELAGMEFSGS